MAMRLEGPSETRESSRRMTPRLPVRAGFQDVAGVELEAGVRGRPLPVAHDGNLSGDFFDAADGLVGGDGREWDQQKRTARRAMPGDHCRGPEASHRTALLQ